MVCASTPCTSNACVCCHVQHVAVDNTLVVGESTTLTTNCATGGALNVSACVEQTSGNLVCITTDVGQQALAVTGSVAVTGNTVLTGTLDVSGATALGSTLDVSGATALTSAALSGTLGVTGATALGSTLAVTNTVSIDGTLTLAEGSITDSGGTIDFGDENLTTTGPVACGVLTSTTTVIAGGQVLGATVNATGAITAGTTVSASGAVTGASVTATGAITGTSVTATGNATIQGDILMQHGSEEGVIRFLAVAEGGVPAGLNLYSGDQTASKSINLHLTNAVGTDSVLALNRNSAVTELVLESKETNDAAVFELQCRNDFTGADHCKLLFSSQTGTTVATRNTCEMKYVPVNGSLVQGEVLLNRDFTVGVNAITGSVKTLRAHGVSDSTTEGAQLIVGAVGTIPTEPLKPSNAPSDGSGRIYALPSYESGAECVAKWRRAPVPTGDATTAGLWELVRGTTQVQETIADDHVWTGDHTHSGALFKTKGTAPTSASATGTVGEIRWDTVSVVGGSPATFVYVCIATDTWTRVQMATW